MIAVRKTSTLLIGIALILFGFGGMAFMAVYEQPFAALSGSTWWGPWGDTSGGSIGRPSASGIDAMFIAEMIPHHEDAIAMADLALTRAEHPELKQLATDIKRTQTAENAQMRQWYREWFGADVPTASAGFFGMMGGRFGGVSGRGMMGGMVDLDQLRAAEPFDKAFIEQMIPHHQMAIMMSQMAGSASGRAEMRGLTQSIITGQTQDIQKMRDWYQRWYGR